ncbi:MAG: mechanosensitive ion channel family protein [Mogibacterium sp.]|nr:mechanosensitive ion channel family protein [Mogibacterium sp.]
MPEDNTNNIEIAETLDPRNEIDAETEYKAHKYFITKVVINVFLMILGAVLIAAFLRQMQQQTALVKQREGSELALTETISVLRENTENAEELTRIYHDGNQDVLDDMSQLFSSGLFDSMAETDNETRSEIFSNVVSRSGVEFLFIMSMDGKIVLSPDASLSGVNPAAYGYMTQENVNEILKGTQAKDGTINPVLVGNQYGSYYFYSMPHNYKGRQYMLVLGTDATALEVQISSLKDISVVLSRAAISNDGFLFAVDQQDGLFLYYKNGSEVLTGQNALEAGLSQEALVDGYSGTQTIKGVDYYCVSKTFGDQTVICAVAQSDKILANDRYVLFWSILGFVLVMILCLTYAVVVRNDFVRRAVVTDRIVLKKDSDNPIYFDKSVFLKVFPLMLVGVLLMYGISFYTQTLLEITEGVEKSEVALNEVTGRYNESIENRETIQAYYNTRSLSKARLISFLIEEDPSVLNEPTDHYHSVYDENGERVFLTDDEGNRLRSVSASARLQELCDANEIASIYIFDEDGHTIGTNTENWFFIISHDEESQSYPFRDVLDGITDVYIQEPMENDLGEVSQYIGVSFNYYTKVSESGETVYASRMEYETALRSDPEAHEGKAGGITAHRAMIQIGLDEALSKKLLESTDVASVLSTNMLSGGFIVMFDNSEDHLCVYSPNEPSIGRSAAELGVSSNAFSGDDYYGFARINGVRYFSFFRYADGYFVATALPQDQMYQARGTIALITAITCFILILILSMTVTLTSKEEEYLYATMSEAQAEKGLNSAIFNVILPSGKSVATTKAAARWDNRHIPWDERSPEQKLITMISVIAGILILYVAATIIGADRFFEDRSIVRYIISGGWDRGWNVFAMSACAIVLTTVSIAVALFRIPVRLITALLGTRGETVGHLLLSVVKYGSVIGAFFYCLYLLGIDSSSLLASAGILSLVIGLGAQSLIKDIIAGIFIVFEGEFRVGDIVTINDYRGTVMDIGLRTTKVLGVDGNIKIYNNSDISGVLNMTQEASIAVCKISIEYGQDVEYVEAVLNRELPRLRQENPALLEEPKYVGVFELGDSGVTLLIIGKCNEKDIKSVTRYLNKEVLQIFYRNGINVPFPQMTFSRLDAKGRKTMRDFIMENSKPEEYEEE